MKKFTQETLAEHMRKIFDEEIMALREAGQKEYAGHEDTPFGNFERLEKDLDMNRKKILWVLAMKHRDGIASFLKGHTSQREDVRGRINDFIVYLFLLRGMVDEDTVDISTDFSKPDDEFPKPKEVVYGDAGMDH